MSKNLLNLLLISLSVGIYYLIINPLYTGVGIIWQPKENVKSLRESNTQYSEALSQAGELYSQAQSLGSQYQNISEETKNKMKVMVPTDIDPVRLLSEINGIANGQGIALIDLSYKENTPTVTGTAVSSTVVMPTGTVPGAMSPVSAKTSDTASTGKQGSYTVTFTVKASYPKVKELIRSLETSLRLFNITHVKLTAPEGGGLDDVTVELQTYYLQ